MSGLVKAVKGYFASRLKELKSESAGISSEIRSQGDTETALQIKSSQYENQLSECLEQEVGIQRQLDKFTQLWRTTSDERSLTNRTRRTAEMQIKAEAEKLGKINSHIAAARTVFEVDRRRTRAIAVKQRRDRLSKNRAYLKERMSAAETAIAAIETFYTTHSREQIGTLGRLVNYCSQGCTLTA